MTRPEKIRRRQRLLIAMQALTAIVAALALILSVTVNQANITRLGQERIQARYSNCLLLRELVFIAAPRDRHAQALAYLARTPLVNCERYAKSAS